MNETDVINETDEIKFCFSSFSILLHSTQQKEFRQNIYQDNAAFAFTSLGVKYDESISGHGLYVFKIHGGLWHLDGTILPEHGETPHFSQVYIYDPSEALRHRQHNNHNSLIPETLNELQEMMQACNRFVHLYRQALERLRDQPDGGINVQARLTYKPHTDRRRYNIPTGNEIAIVLPGEGMAEDGRDIILQLKGGGLQRIREYSPTYIPLHYVLLFPRGELGWHSNIPLQGQTSR